MGFVRSSLLLKFDDPELDGLEVRSQRLSFDGLFVIADLRATDWSDTKAAKQAAADLAKELGEVLTSWNLEAEEKDKDGKPTGNLVPVPLNVASIAKLDYVLMNRIAGAVADASAGVSPPLPPPSSDSDTSVEESIPMETLSDPLPV